MMMKGSALILIVLLCLNCSSKHSIEEELEGSWNVTNINICNKDLTNEFLFRMFNFSYSGGDYENFLKLPHFSYDRKRSGNWKVDMDSNKIYLHVYNTEEGIFDTIYNLEFLPNNKIVLLGNSIELECSKVVFSLDSPTIKLDIFDFIKEGKTVEDFKGREICNFLGKDKCCLDVPDGLSVQ